MNSFGVEKAVTFRQPATANLMIDSRDRLEAVYSSPWNFQITKRQALQNGFMTRCGTTEVVLEWYNPNIRAPNNVLTVDISGTGLVSDEGITIPEGFYTVAEILDYLVDKLNDLSGTSGVGFSIDPLRTFNSEFILAATGGEFRFENTYLANQLRIFLPAPVPEIPLFYGIDLREYRYLDFVSSQLTYNQDLKDTSSSDIERDVLCRWYMAFDDVASAEDTYGFPVLMGYKPFVLRRLFNPPKQIKWDSAASIGNLAFEIYGSDGLLVVQSDAGDSQWLMTLQCSEN